MEFQQTSIQRPNCQRGVGWSWILGKTAARLKKMFSEGLSAENVDLAGGKSYREDATLQHVKFLFKVPCQAKWDSLVQGKVIDNALFQSITRSQRGLSLYLVLM